MNYSYHYQNWYPSVDHETKNTKKNVGFYDLTPFSKFDLKGENVHSELQRICTANIKSVPGKTTYTQILNDDGGIEIDLTVVCLDKNYFRLVSSAATRERDKFYILKNLSEQIEFKDVTDDYCCLGLFGPKTRDLLAKLSKDDFSNDNFKFGFGKNVEIKNTKVWAQRLSYVGELGFELYVDTKNAKKLYTDIVTEEKTLIYLIVECMQWTP